MNRWHCMIQVIATRKMVRTDLEVARCLVDFSMSTSRLIDVDTILINRTASCGNKCSQDGRASAGRRSGVIPTRCQVGSLYVNN